MVVDEAQIFAPAVAGEVSDEVRRMSLGAMTNLMCRGRKRGLAGVIATQRLAKLAKNVAAEASNFLMGRTFLDIDMARAADLLGMERRQAEPIRDLERGHFLRFGPGDLAPPAVGPDRRRRHLGAQREPQAGAFALGAARGPAQPAGRAARRGAAARTAAASRAARRRRSHRQPAQCPRDALDARAGRARSRRTRYRSSDAVLRDIVADPDSGFQQVPNLYQDFLLRCRMRGLADPRLGLPDFRWRLGLARAGIVDRDADWAPALDMARALPEDMLGAFLLVARAAKHGEPCPSEDVLAMAYGTRSPGRVRRLLQYIEERGFFVARVDLTGKRSISLPALGWTTAPSPPPAEMPARAGAASGAFAPLL